jgi:prepilin signal peptidase PulO-like enzyme (type II secretory pathway)
MIRTAENNYIGPLEDSEVAKGLLAGWIRISDEARDPWRGWVSIRVRLHHLFEVRALIDSRKAFAEAWAPSVTAVASPLSLLAYVSGLVFFIPEFGPTEATWFVAVTVIGLLVVCGFFRKSYVHPIWGWVALMLFAVIGGGLLHWLTDLSINFVQFLKGAVGALFFGGVIGYGIGYGLGWLVGWRHRSLYSVSEKRQPIPQDVIVRDYDPWEFLSNRN